MRDWFKGGGLVSARLVEGLFNGEISAGAVNDSASGTIFDKFETVAKSITLADQSQDFDFPCGQCELQARDFVQLDLLEEHDGDTGFAEIDRMSANDGTVAGVDPNVRFQFEAGRAAGLDEFRG